MGHNSGRFRDTPLRVALLLVLDHLELVAGADQGHIWYWHRDHFGRPANGDPTAMERPDGEEGFGPRDDAEDHNDR